jgi:hypothetical protein
MLDALSKVGARSFLDARGTELTPAVVAALVADSQSHQDITVYLDEFEQLCGAVNCGVINEAYTRELEAGRVIRIFIVFKPIIEHQQSSNPLAYVEFEKVADKWEGLRTAHEAAEKAREQAAKKRKRHNSGVKPAVP